MSRSYPTVKETYGQSIKSIKDPLERLRKLYELSMRLSGDPVDVFKHVAFMIGEVFDVRVVCLSEIRDEELYFISVYADGEVTADVGHCALDVTPCATVDKTKDIRTYDEVVEKFPQAAFLKTHNAHSYCGFPALDSRGDVIAVTCLLDDKPHEFTEDDQRMLRIFGQRIGYEIERKREADARAQAVMELQESNERFRQLAENINEVFWLGSPDWSKIYYISPAYERYWGRNVEDLYSNPRAWLDAIHPDDIEQVLAEIPSDISDIDDHVDFSEYRIIDADGEIKWIKARGFPIRDDEGNIIRIAGIAENITERKKSEQLVFHQAHFDSLTNLPNRFLSLDRLTQLIQEAERNKKKVAILFFDLDDFKKVNDTLGHAFGDKVLIEAARRLSKSVRSGDTVGRLGGDEFIVLLSGLNSASEAAHIAEYVLDQFRDIIRIGNKELMLTGSLGISIYPDNGDNVTELLRNADSAMYHSKDLGRNTYSYFNDEMNHDVSRRLAIEEQLHGALNRNELEVVYQPKINLSNLEITGVEALLRWNNPVLGRVSPDEFIPIAEHIGIIVELGKFVLNEAMSATHQWHMKYGPSLHVAVNISPRQFRDTELVPFISEAMNKYDIKGDYLEIEITEGIFMTGYQHVDESVDKLNALGVHISMDDFGSGYSSLNYLRRYPFNVLKIDRSYITDMTNVESDRQLVIASIAMAHSLNLKVVAEGVETKEQLDQLIGMGCDFAQGRYFSMPVSRSKLEELLDAGGKY